MPVILDGTNGVSTPNTFAFKNRLINGNFGINQRGVSGTVTLAAGAYGHDRFKAGASGCTYTFATSNNVTTLTISSGSLQQVVEGLNLETGTYALSWTGTAQGKIGAGSYGASGVTGSITGGTNTTVEFNTGTLSLVQLEKGSTATSFDYRPYGTELQLCQRYFQLSGGAGRSVATATIEVLAPFNPPMRAAPSSPTIINGTGNAVQYGRPATNINSVSAIYVTTAQGTGVSVVTADTGLTTGSAAFINPFALGFSAEL